MGELQLIAGESFSFLDAMLWCFYPIVFLILIEAISSGFDDDDDQGGGMMMPAYEGSR